MTASIARTALIALATGATACSGGGSSGGGTAPTTLNVSIGVGGTPGQVFVLGQSVVLTAQVNGATAPAYSWSFGDGTTSTVGPEVSHTYVSGPAASRIGSVMVNLTVTSGGSSGNATAQIQLGKVTGCWSMPADPNNMQAAPDHLSLTQTGASISGGVMRTAEGGLYPLNAGGTIDAQGVIRVFRADGDRSWALSGDPTLTKLTGKENHLTGAPRSDDVTLTFQSDAACQ